MDCELRVLVFALLVIVSTATPAAPTDLDPAFGDRGVARLVGAATTDDGAFHPDQGLAVLVDRGHRFTSNSRVIRLDPAGRVDTNFLPILPLPSPRGNTTIEAVAVTQDGRTVTRQLADWFPGCDFWLTRHLPSGALDNSFGWSGSSQLQQGLRCLTGNLALDRRGDAHFALATATWFSSSTSVLRVDAGGIQIDRLGGMGVTYDTLKWVHDRLAVQSDGRPVAVMRGSESGVAVMRLFGTIPDPRFGTAGLAIALTPEHSRGHDVAIAPDGRIVVVGIGNLRGVPQLVVARFTTDGRVDATFGSGGVKYVEAARAGERVVSARVAVQVDGRIVVAGTVEKVLSSGEPFPRIAAARLTGDGQPDSLFAPAGIADLWWQRGAALSFLLLRHDGRIVMGAAIWSDFSGRLPVTEAAVVQLKGGDDSVARPLRERKAVEYFHAGYGHYFLTADAEEIATLDVTPARGWARTGHTLRVWDGDDPTLQPVCRFWSDGTWSPKSSHFYTPYDAECENVKADPAWYFERNAFKVRMPEGPLGARTCAVASSPLYRAYNNGRTGAPNHRYITDPALLDEMIAQGWTMEGEATTRIFACVPIQ